MKPRPLALALGVLSPEELLDRLAFGESESPLVAVGPDEAPGLLPGFLTGVGWLLELNNPRRMGGGRPWRIFIGSAAKSSVRRSMSGYILRELGADSSSLRGSSRVDHSMCVGVVTVIVAAGVGTTD
jgi:hypothetical protein